MAGSSTRRVFGKRLRRLGMKSVACGRLLNNLCAGISNRPLFKNPVKSPTSESSFKLIEAVSALLRCDELQRDDVSQTTHELIEGVIEGMVRVRRESGFPGRGEGVWVFAKRDRKRGG